MTLRKFSSDFDLFEFANANDLQYAYEGSSAFAKRLRERRPEDWLVKVMVRKGEKYAILRKREKYIPPQPQDYAFYKIKYDGYSGKRVGKTYDELDEEERDYLPHEHGGGYDLPPSHMHSAWYEPNQCAYCGEISDDLVGDHIVPYSKGGADGSHPFGIDNTAPACDPCNRKKWHYLGWKTLDGRTGFYWDGTPGHMPSPPMPQRARRR